MTPHHFANSLNRLCQGLPFPASASLALALNLACGGSGGGGMTSPGGGNNNVAPAITAQPSGTLITLGQSAIFSVAAAGSPAPAYQWERSSDGNTWSSVNGATSAAFSFIPAKADHAAQFRAKASNVAGTATSNPAPLAVQWAPTFITQPTVQAVSSPDPATFSALAEANPAARYQWQTSSNGTLWTDQPGATSASFQTGPTSNSMNNFQFRATAANSKGSATSSAATLLVNVPTFTLTVNLGNGATGSPATTAIYALGTAVNYSYSLQPGFTNLQVLLDGSHVSATGILTMNGAHTLAITASTHETPTLIIRSGFESTTTLYLVNNDILGFRGTDQSVAPPNDWTEANADPNIGYFYCQLGAPGSTIDRNAFITTDPINPLNHALAFRITKATEPGPPLKGRVSMNIGENNGLQEIYYKVKLFLPTDFSYLKDYTFTPGNWMALMELWHNPDWTTPAPYPFRISLYVIKSPDNQNLNFGVEAQSMDPNNWKTIWSMPNTSFNLPSNQWLQMEVYYKDGNASTGRFYMSVTQPNGQKTILFDVTNFTHHPQNPSPDGLRWINPMKLYCSESVVDWISSHQPQNGTLQIFWDDFEFWKNKNPF